MGEATTTSPIGEAWSKTKPKSAWSSWVSSRAPSSAISSLSSRCAVSSGLSPSSSSFPAGSSRSAASPHRLARLAHQDDVLAVVREHRHRAGVLDDLAFGLLAVVVAEAVDADLRDPTLPGRAAAGALEAHRRPASVTIASVTSSIVSSASSVTDSSGWWLRSVPFARLTTGRPDVISALASLPPPVVM